MYIFNTNLSSRNGRLKPLHLLFHVLAFLKLTHGVTQSVFSSLAAFRSARGWGLRYVMCVTWASVHSLHVHSSRYNGIWLIEWHTEHDEITVSIQGSIGSYRLRKQRRDGFDYAKTNFDLLIDIAVDRHSASRSSSMEERDVPQSQKC
jgi:hypothetical protein